MKFCGILKFGEGVGNSGLELEKLVLKVLSGRSFKDCICSMAKCLGLKNSHQGFNGRLQPTHKAFQEISIRHIRISNR